MTLRLLKTALLAGAGAGLLAALLHFFFIQELILSAERYESGEAMHFGGVPAPEGAEAGHDHGEHDHGEASGAGNGHELDLGRDALTVAFSVLLYAGYAMLLTAAIAVAGVLGRRIGPAEGVLWGIGGYAAVQLAPALGLPPELPGTLAAELSLRQVWWLATALCTAGGLALLAWGRGFGVALGAVALLALPHLVGAPHPEGFAGTAPPELGAAFAARTLGTGLAVWAAMGWLAARLWSSEAA